MHTHGHREREVRSAFSKLSIHTSRAVGSPWAFTTALLVVIAWGLLGPANHFSDTWQLVINTATTIVTFLMVFLIQYTQNRDSYVVQLKLDELIRSIHGARDSLVAMEHMTDEELERLEQEFERLRASAAHHRRKRRHARAAERRSD